MASTTKKSPRGKIHDVIQTQPGLGREKYLFGSDEEIQNRDEDGDNPGLHPAPRFQQIVARDTDKDMNNPSGPTKSGHFKFSSGPDAQGSAVSMQMPDLGGGMMGGSPGGAGAPQGAPPTPGAQAGPDPMALMAMLGAGKKKRGGPRKRGVGKGRRRGKASGKRVKRRKRQMETKWRKGEPARSEDDAASKRLRRVRDQEPDSEVQHYPGRSFTGPGNQKAQAANDPRDANSLSKSIKAQTARFQRSRAGDRFADLGSATARVSEPVDEDD